MRAEDRCKLKFRLIGRGYRRRVQSGQAPGHLLWGERTPFGPSLREGEYHAEWPKRVDAILEGVEEHAVERWAASASLLRLGFSYRSVDGTESQGQVVTA